MRRLTVCTIAILVLLSTRIVLAQTTARESAGALGSLSGFVLNPWITPALVLLGMVLIIAELVSIGSWGATGTAGVLCLGAVVGSSILAGVAVTVGLALLLVGTALMLIESRVLPGKGISAVAGLACLFMGLYWTLGGASVGVAYAASVSTLFTVLAAVAFLVHLPTNSAWAVAGRRVEMHEQHREVTGASTGHAAMTHLEPEPPRTHDRKVPGHDTDYRHTEAGDDDQITNRNG